MKGTSRLFAPSRSSERRRRVAHGARRLAGPAGFSVVEVLVASLVAGIAIVGIALMFGTGSAWVSVLGEDRVALGLAEQEIERMRDGGFTAALDGLGKSTEVCVRLGGRLAPPDGEPCPEGEKTFTVERCLQYVSPERPGTLGEPRYSRDACPEGSPVGLVPTLRMTVTVIQNRQPQASPVVLQAWLTAAGR